MGARGIGPRHDAAARDGKGLERRWRCHITGTGDAGAFLSRFDAIAVDPVQHADHPVALSTEASHLFARDDRLAGLRILDARENGAAMTDGRDNAASFPHG